jgi:hypothetical protein
VDELIKDTQRMIRQIRREPIIEPGPGQYVDRCDFSKTGWAVWNADGGCTCKPARARPATGGREG